MEKYKEKKRKLCVCVVFMDLEKTYDKILRWTFRGKEGLKVYVKEIEEKYEEASTRVFEFVNRKNTRGRKIKMCMWRNERF